ncbi:MAG TPA: leucine--tRNA ligase [Acidiferrobacterales bacterium]|nr:leucine--tRNA ligase [Acidiferrobacterales bacterium]
MDERYFPEKVEREAQAYWERHKSFKVTEDSTREKYYCLSMFPYPSGKLHMGHVRNYTIGDVIARYQRMQGKNVLQPMGWDAFGLPAENAAMANGVPPAKWTYDNIAYMKQQLQSLGFAIDWTRELATCKPDYYKWNQWLFLRMLEKGIAYKKTGVVNWDPVDQTVLANEQVIDGRGWRTGAPVEKREIPMYYLAITKYADELLADLDKLTEWPERVRTMQANWIGKSYGVRFAFKVNGIARSALGSPQGGMGVRGDHPHPLPSPEGRGEVGENLHFDRDGVRDASDLPDAKGRFPHPLPSPSPGPSGHPLPVGEGELVRPPAAGSWVGKVGESLHDGLLWVFTTRADTIMGVTFCAAAAEHPLATYAAKNNPKLAAFITECKRGSVMEADLAAVEKQGMPTGISVIHPLTGEPIPVWVGNYVLMGYGEGAVMGVPAHDQRDFEFAQKYGLPIKPVIKPKDGALEQPLKAAYVEYGVCFNSGKYDGLDYWAAVDAIAIDLKAQGLGDKQVMWRLRDWGISRQRYWGCPIPIIYCDQCGDVPVPDDRLPVKLPEDCVPDGMGNPLNKRADFVNTACPKCGARARRETDTMDTFVDSSWYYARYCCSDNPKAMVDARVDYWMPVDQYIGGIEHAILHLLYSRFWWKVMRDVQGSTSAAGGRMPGAADVGLVHGDEPFTRLLTQGMVLNEIFLRTPASGRTVYYDPADIEVQHDQKGQRIGAVLKSDGRPVESGGIGTMSKSKNNGVDPQTLIDRYGADTARLFMMFAAPPEDTLEWSDSGVEGAFRFLKRLWSFAYKNRDFIRGDSTPIFIDWSSAPGEHRKARREIHLALKQANHDFRKSQFNTVVSAAMKMLNALEGMPSEPVKGDKIQPVYQAIVLEGLSILLRLLSPMIPHFTHCLWKELRYGDDVLSASWPEHDANALAQDQIEIVVQVNGKLRGRIQVPVNADQSKTQAIALADEKIARHIAGKPVKKVIVVPAKLVNIVI